MPCADGNGCCGDNLVLATLTTSLPSLVKIYQCVVLKYICDFTFRKPPCIAEMQRRASARVRLHDTGAATELRSEV